MGLIQKKDEKDVIEGIEVIERSDVPDDLPKTEVDLVGGASAEEIASGVSAEEAAAAAEAEMIEGARDEELMEGIEGKEAESARESEVVGEAPAAKEVAPKRNVLLVAAVVIALIVGAVGGYFAGSGGFGAAGAGAATLTEDQLDSAVGSYTYNGATKTITAREAIEAQYSLDSVKNDDGTYAVPGADTVLAYARNQIMLAEAESRGITADDDEMAEYAESMIGTSDYATMASQYQLSEDQAKEIVRESVVLNKLYQEIVPEAADVPTAPTEPEDGNEETASKDYADYIIGLAGDEWDSETGTWADENSTYAQAFTDDPFTADSATYAQAMTAYYVAYQLYSEANSNSASTWTDYANGLLAKANLTLYGLCQ